MTNGWKFFILGWLMAVLFGCSAMQTQPASKIIAVSRFDQIAGKWEGLSKRVPDMHRHAWVVLLISDRGTCCSGPERSTFRTVKCSRLATMGPVCSHSMTRLVRQP